MSVTAYENRVKDSYTGTPGTGNVTITNSAPTGFRTFDARYGHAGTHFKYVIDHGSEWEIGEGHLSNATTLVRDSVESSSNADGLVNFTSGANEIYADVPASVIAALVARGGDVVGPSSASDGNVAMFSGSTGKLLEDGGFFGDLANDAINTYLDGGLNRDVNFRSADGFGIDLTDTPGMGDLDGVGNGTKIIVDDAAGTVAVTAPNGLIVNGAAAPKVYRATLTQLSSAPTPTVLENTLSGTPAWARTGTGTFTLTLTGEFPSGKVFARCESPNNLDGIIPKVERISDDVIQLQMRKLSVAGGVASYSSNDAALTDTPFEVLVYP